MKYARIDAGNMTKIKISDDKMHSCIRYEYKVYKQYHIV